jgi:hypothetical protein
VGPANAILNYLYAILEAEARIAALAVGADPLLAFLHSDQRNRDSLACDLMEPVRPKVDAFVLDLLASREFRKEDFFELRDGQCRLLPPLTYELINTAPLWSREVLPVTQAVAVRLLEFQLTPARVAPGKRGDGLRAASNPVGGWAYQIGHGAATALSCASTSHSLQLLQVRRPTLGGRPRQT